MSRATQISDRIRIEAFFRELFRGEAGIAANAAEALARRCAGRIKRVVVWDDPDTAAPPGAAVSAVCAEHMITSAAPASVSAVSGSPGPDAAPAFDPYAFSAVMVLTKTGRDGLLKRLATIERPEHLKKIAEAQHLAVDASLSSVTDLRTAIVEAAELRIANRRAAAS